MKMISKNAETIVLLCIIFYIFFSLVVLYETKINTLEFDIQKYNDDIEETNDNYFEDENNLYSINVEYIEKINNEYIKVKYNEYIDVIKLDTSLVNTLTLNTNYNIVLVKTSNKMYNIHDLAGVIENNKVKSIVRR
ncbi:MAG: hypothetical protein IJ018_03945 [Bacilli bacterium]|nr:hypothetical protein [Bacilli bacterium]